MDEQVTVHDDGITELPDGSGFFVGEVPSPGDPDYPTRSSGVADDHTDAGEPQDGLDDDPVGDDDAGDPAKGDGEETGEPSETDGSEGEVNI